MTYVLNPLSAECYQELVRRNDAEWLKCCLYQCQAHILVTDWRCQNVTARDRKLHTIQNIVGPLDQLIQQALDNARKDLQDRRGHQTRRLKKVHMYWQSAEWSKTGNASQASIADASDIELISVGSIYFFM